MAGLAPAITSEITMALFSEKNRTRMSPMRQGERLFDFCDSSGRESISIYRELLNIWIMRYPDSERTEIVRRFVKGSNHQFYATLAEIILHEALFSGSGHIKYHPELPKSSARPDFLKLSTAGNVESYVEVTTCAPAEQDVAAGNRLASIYNAIDKARLPSGFSLGVNVEEYGKTSPNLSFLTKEIENWAADAHTQIVDAQSSPQIFTVDDWKIELTLIKFSESSELAERSIGAFSCGARWIDGSGDIRERLENKARRYGILHAPFLIVIADCKGEVGWGDSAKRELIEALFGDEAMNSLARRVRQPSY